MNSLANEFHVSQNCGNIPVQPLDFGQNHGGNSACVELASGARKFTYSKEKALRSAFIRGACASVTSDATGTSNMMLPKRKSTPSHSTPVPDVAHSRGSTPNEPTQDGGSSNKRLKTVDLEEFNAVCKEAAVPTPQNASINTFRIRSILDLLMNKENCLDEITDDISEVYSSLTSSVNRLDVHAKPNGPPEGGDTTSTTDVSRANAELDRSRGDSSDSSEGVDAFEEVTKCIADREYFERLETPPCVSFMLELDAEHRLKLQDALAPAIDKPPDPGGIAHWLFLLNVALLSIADENALSVETLYDRMMWAMSQFSGCGASSNSSIKPGAAPESERTEEMFLDTLHNVGRLLDLLNLDELTGLFRALFEFFYSTRHPDLVVVRANRICSDVLTRLQVDHMQQILKGIAQDFERFDADQNQIGDGQKKPDNVFEAKKGESVANTYYVNTVIAIFERIFVNARKADTAGEDDVNIFDGLERDENKAYGTFRASLRSFAEEALLNESTEGRKAKAFVETVLQNLLNVRHMFAAFVVLELLNLFLDRLQGDPKERGRGNKSSVRTLRMLITIATFVHNRIYSKVLGLEGLRHTNKYLGSDGLPCRIRLSDLRDHAKSYADYVSIGAWDGEAGLGTCVLHILLKWHCATKDLQGVGDLLPFVRMFRYLAKHSEDYKDAEHTLTKINFTNVYNYPYSYHSAGEPTDSLALQVFAHHVLDGCCERVMDCLIGIVNTTNESNVLKLCVDFMARVIGANHAYLKNEHVRGFLTSALNDYNANMRCTILGIYLNFLAAYGQPNKGEGQDKRGLDNYIDRDAVTKITGGIHDLNYKVRLAAIKVAHMYLHLNRANIGEHLDVVAALCQKSLDLHREQAQVKSALYSLLTGIFFKYTVENISRAGGAENRADAKALELLDKLIGLVLYKMEAYKSKANPFVVMASYHKTNAGLINDPVRYYGGGGPDPEGPADTEKAVETWMNNLLDLFLCKRYNGDDHYKLGEVLTVYKLFGEVRPRLFASHIGYFLPYVNVGTGGGGTKLSVDQINLITLINGLLVTIYGSADGGQSGTEAGESIDSVRQTVESNMIALLSSVSSPILIRSIIQLLSQSNKAYIDSLYTSSHLYVKNNTDALIERVTRGRGRAGNARIEGIDGMYKCTWILGCFSEFNEADTGLLRLFVETYKRYQAAGILNLAGLYVECVGRFLSNPKNLADGEGLKAAIGELHEHVVAQGAREDAVAVLHHLTSMYQRLAAEGGDRELANTLYVAGHKYISEFARIAQSPEAGEGDDVAKYMEAVEAIVVNRLTNAQELVPLVFRQLLAREPHVQRAAEHNLRLIIKQDVNAFLNKLNSSFEGLRQKVVREFFRGHAVLGTAGEKTYAAVQGILRIYLEVLQTKRSNVRTFVTAVLIQVRACTHERAEGVRAEVRRNAGFRWAGMTLEKKTPKRKADFGHTLRTLAEGLKRGARNGEKAALEYFAHLHANMMCVILEHLTFKTRAEANFAVTKIQEVANDATLRADGEEKLRALVNTRLKRIAAKVKNTHK